jgi:hypothetical protein
MSIFVSIAAYRDPDVENTIKDLFEKAKNPEEIFVGLVLQDELDKYYRIIKEYKNVKTIFIDYKKSLGACWARYCAQNLWNDEYYYMQLDSHHRFIKNWDDEVIKELKRCKSNKPILSTYLPCFNPVNNDKKNENWIMNIDSYRFIILNFPTFIPQKIEIEEPQLNKFISGHFIFCDYRFIQEVKYNKNLYFIGEEIDLSLRAWANDWDIYQPSKIIAWHEYTREGRPKHWDDNEKWWKLDLESKKNVVKMINSGNYDGKNRNLDDWKIKFGCDLKNIKLSKECFKCEIPKDEVKLFSPIKLKLDNNNFKRVIIKSEDNLILFNRDIKEVKQGYNHYKEDVIKFFNFEEKFNIILE